MSALVEPGAERHKAPRGFGRERPTKSAPGAFVPKVFILSKGGAKRKQITIFIHHRAARVGNQSAAQRNAATIATAGRPFAAVSRSAFGCSTMAATAIARFMVKAIAVQVWRERWVVVLMAGRVSSMPF